MAECELVQRALRECSTGTGRRLSFAEYMECQAFEQLAGCAFPEEKVRRKFYAEIQRDLAARADQDEDDHEDEALEAPWAAVAADYGRTGDRRSRSRG